MGTGSRPWRRVGCTIAAATIASVSVGGQTAPAGVADPASWPAVADPVPADPRLKARIAAILARMSVEQKVGQVIQADVASVTPDEVAQYHLGSVLNGGNSAPGGKRYATGAEWLAGADAFYAASVRPQGELPVIPILWGSDAVHGHSKAIGATLFPHNIGLGAMRDPELMRRIGAVTAIEMRVTGLDWTFAPTLAVVRDDRWGRAYEGFSEDPAVVASYARPLVEGLQGKVGAKDWLQGDHIVATAKHFVGDGGTTSGKDQGYNASPEAELRDVQAAGYAPALSAGVQSVMASYSSWQGAKMHGNASLLTGVLKGRMGFGGFVVGDWNGHGQLPGCTPTDCPASVAAGLDMYMAPDSWKALHASTLKAVKAGTLPMARLDDAVTRILRVKLRSGVFDNGKPSARANAGKFELLGAPAHRAIARQAVRQSLVLLKNDGVLPLKPGQQLLVAGDGADNFMKQSGGWTLSWQGTGLKREDFPGATTIGTALVSAAGGSGELRPDGNYASKPDVAVVVFGEDPYAEFQGDIPDLAFRDRSDSLALLKRYRAAGIRTVAVFLSGRPLWVNPWINAADAFVAAWLPGSEGGGVADVLFGKADFTGTLPFSWPKTATQTRLNVGDPGYDPLFAFGHGLTYARSGKVAALSEDSGIVGGAGAPAGTWFQRGKIGTGLAMELVAGGAVAPVNAGPAATPNGWLRSAAVDRNAQEDSLRLTWSGGGPAQVVLRSAAPLDIARESNGELSIEIDVSADTLGSAPLMLAMGSVKGVDLAPALRRGTGWQTVSVRLSCFAGRGADMTRVTVPLVLSTSAATDLRVSRIALGSTAVGAIGCD